MNSLWKNVEGERSNSVYTDQTFMVKIEQPRDKIGQHNITSIIINLCVIQLRYNKGNSNTLGSVWINLLGQNPMLTQCDKITTKDSLMQLQTIELVHAQFTNQGMWENAPKLP